MTNNEAATILQDQVMQYTRCALNRDTIDSAIRRAICNLRNTVIIKEEILPAPISTEPLCPVCSSLLKSRGGYIRVIIGRRDMVSEVQGASWYCDKCDRVWDWDDVQLLGNSEQLLQHAKKLTSNALAGTDYADRLRWLLSQAERVVTVDAEDRRAVERACKLLKQIDNGFDAVRGLIEQ